MGVVPEKQKQFENIIKYANELKESLTASLGGEDGYIYVASEEGDAKDHVALVYIEVPSFSTFALDEKRIFGMALSQADAVNFFVTEDGWVRISLAVLGYYEIDDNDALVDTSVLEFKKKS